ncbi:MAG: hypothetical protein FJ320_05475 [SAR202 cluster bacterium]|nr:hypothetical protein [SAR202 cluster bacterium]
MALKKRVEVLFEPSKFSYLEEIARRRKTSVGKLIREAVEKTYLEADLEKRREAVKWLASQKIDFGGDWDVVKKQIIEERVRQIEESLENYNK